MKKQVQAFLRHFFSSYFAILLLSLITVPILLFTVIFFGTIRFSVGIFLKIKYSKHFHRLFPGSDAMWTIQDPSQAVISTVFITESKKSFKEFVEYVRNDVCSAFVNHPSKKLRCTRHRELGYSFLLKSTCSLSDFQENCVRKVKIEGDFNRNSLTKIISDNLNKELPFNNTALWEILVFDKEIEWSSNKKKYFVIDIRMHHCVADGINLVKLLLEHLSDTKEVEKELSCIITSEKKSLRKKINKICQFLGAITFGPALQLINTVSRPKDLNILFGRPLSGEKIVTFKSESRQEFVTMVKQIKTKFSTSEMRFSDVVFAAIAASFRDFYKKQGDIPEHISAIIPALFSNNFNIKEKNNLTNNFSIGTINLSISKQGQEVLHEIHEKMDKLRNSPEYVVNYYLNPIISAVLPEPLLRKMLISIPCTLVISCLPGTEEKLQIFHGEELQDVIFWLPHRGFTGVGVSMLTYDGRFEFGLTVDKALIPDEKSAQEITDGVFKHIQNIYNSLL